MDAAAYKIRYSVSKCTVEYYSTNCIIIVHLHKTNHLIVHRSPVETRGLTLIVTKYVTESIAVHPTPNMATRVNVSHSLAM